MEMEVFSFFTLIKEVFKGAIILILWAHAFIMPLVGVVHMLLLVSPHCKCGWQLFLLIIGKVLYWLFMLCLIIYPLKAFNSDIVSIFLYGDRFYVISSFVPYISIGLLRDKYE